MSNIGCVKNEFHFVCKPCTFKLFYLYDFLIIHWCIYKYFENIYIFNLHDKTI